MAAEIRRLTSDQFAALLQAAAPTLTRRIDAVHLHHTWRPTRSQFKGQSTLEAMRNYHVNTNRWNDIAQHLTIDPHGFAWTGRNWNAPPASQAGKNGTSQAGPFMIEIIGDFDEGRDVLEGRQRACVIAVVSSLLRSFTGTTSSIFFHRDLGSPKTCPGTSVDKARLLAEIQAALGPAARTAKAARKGRSAKRAPAEPEAPPSFDATHWLGHEVTRPVDPPPAGYEAWEVPEHEHAARSIAEEAEARVRAVVGADDRDFHAALARTSGWEALRPHVVNLTKGRLSQGGEFQMPAGSIETIIESIRQYAEITAEPRVMLHAHGGLVGEKSALQYALTAKEWWKEHRVYPVYFVWETHLFEVLKQRLGLARGWAGDARDLMFEAAARAAGGGAIWGDMKESARLSSTTDAGDGEAGGALIFAEALAALIKSRPAGRDITVHAVGHSAGAIFHTHFVPELLRLGVRIASLAFLAPAVRADLFKEKLLQPITTRDVKAFEMFTMEEDAERGDDLVEVLGVTLYGKSLLYLVSRAFEPKRRTHILGLDEMLAGDTAIRKLFSHGARLELSLAMGKDPNPATRARKHGCFDNDEATLASVLQTITGAAPGTPFPVKDGSCNGAAVRARPVWPPLASGFASGSLASRAAAPAVRRALCVGIDSYRESPLAGCVRDADTWAGALRQLQFDVTTVLDRDATRQRMLDALQVLVESARPGDVLVFQYSGHGTQARDLNGDESDRFDEALVPIDYDTGALLLDDDLADVYRRLPGGAVLTLFMDCCHSGTNSRFAPLDRTQARGSERRRFLPLTPDVEEAHRRFRAGRVAARPTSPEESLPGIIHFAACLDNQYAYESSGQGHFTRVASAELAAAVSRGVTNESFNNDVATNVIALGRPQTPQLMRLPAGLAGRSLLAATATDGLSVPLPPGAVYPGPDAGGAPLSSGDRAWEEQCLQFFEAGAALWRQRLGR
jgi:hypothetical protein